MKSVVDSTAFAVLVGALFGLFLFLDLKLVLAFMS